MRFTDPLHTPAISTEGRPTKDQQWVTSYKISYLLSYNSWCYILDEYGHPKSTITFMIMHFTNWLALYIIVLSLQVYFRNFNTNITITNFFYIHLTTRGMRIKSLTWNQHISTPDTDLKPVHQEERGFPVIFVDRYYKYI